MLYEIETMELMRCCCRSYLWHVKHM